jgi:tetratricopeptide (TPR) repeat protein
LSNAHGILGMVYLWHKQPERAIAEAERAIALNPGDALSYTALGHILAYTGRPEEAVRAIEKALQLHPRLPAISLLNVGLAYHLSGRPEEAIATLPRALSYTPLDLGIHVLLAATYSELGQGEEARAEAAEVLRLNPRFSLEVHKQRVPIKDPVTLERHLAALRKAGFQ